LVGPYIYWVFEKFKSVEGRSKRGFVFIPSVWENKGIPEQELNVEYSDRLAENRVNNPMDYEF
jgi:hypothetical protein